MDDKQMIEQDNVPDDEDDLFGDSIDFKLDMGFTHLLRLIGEQKDKHKGTDLGRQVAILYTELEKVYAFFTYIPSLDYQEEI